MIVIPQSHEIVRLHAEEDFNNIVRAARICYQSELLDDIEKEKKFVAKLIKRGELSPIEHSSMSVIFITNRGVTHELVRHRLASYNQESTRYCNYAKDKFFDAVIDEEPLILGEDNVTFIWDPCILDEHRDIWLEDLLTVEKMYMRRLSLGYPPEIARGTLTNDLKTQIMVTANFREWRHIFTMRYSNGAHPHIRALMKPLLKEVHEKVPVIFDDIPENIE